MKKKVDSRQLWLSLALNIIFSNHYKSYILKISRGASISSHPAIHCDYLTITIISPADIAV